MRRPHDPGERKARPDTGERPGPLPLDSSGGTTSEASVIGRGSVGLALVLVVLAGCSAFPNMDAGSAGCQNAIGIGARDRQTDQAPGQDTLSVMPDLHGLRPDQARGLAAGRGHTVVFDAGGSCWCVPPAGGVVSGSWWGQRGALWLWVDGAETPPGEPPFRGWNC